MNKLLVTIEAPSLSFPLDVSYYADGQITVDLNQYNNNIDPDTIPEKIGPVFGNISVTSSYPQNSKFTSISYTGKSLLLYDVNNTLLENNSGNYPKIKKIVAGIVEGNNKTPSTSSPSPDYGLSMICSIFIIMIIIGISIGIYVELKSTNTKKALTPQSGSFFTPGE